MDKETFEIAINLTVLSGVVAFFGWVAKSLIEVNKSKDSEVEKFKSQLEREKKLEMENERRHFQIEMQKKDSELEILKSKYQSIEESYKREIEILNRMTAPNLVDHLTETKNKLDSALNKVRQELNQEESENKQLNKRLSELEKSIQSVSVLDVAKITRYESRLKNDLRAADFLNQNSQKLISHLIQSFPEVSGEMIKNFSKDVETIIYWLSSSLKEGHPKAEKVVITTNLINSCYENVIEEIKQYSQHELTEETFKALNFYLKKIISRLQTSKSTT